MKALFGAPKMPEMAQPPAPPTIDNTRQAEEDLARLRRRRGLQSTFLFGRGKPGAPSAGAMLGSGERATMGGGGNPAAGGGGSAPSKAGLLQ